VRSLHKNLSFSKEDMRKAIGTSIRNAKRDLKKQQHYEQRRINAQEQQENGDPDEENEGTDNTIDMETTFNKNGHIADECEDTMEHDEDEDDDNNDDDTNDDFEDEDDEKEMNNLMIDEEFDGDDE
jgi:hypothetical protein